jgi:EmrB/QacA subfamily drug resistance transporter
MAHRWRVLLVTSTAVFMSFLDVSIVNIAFPDMRASFAGASLARLSWVINAYSVVLAAALIPAGRLADRVGRRRLFLAGTLLFLTASVACGLAPWVEALIAARVVQALGAAIIVPTSLALILPEFPLHQRATATALWGATGAVAAATGPSLGGLLVDWQGWRWVFFVNLLIGIPALLPARRLLREYRDRRPGYPDGLGALLLTAAVAALALAIVQGPEWGWGSSGVLAALAVVALLLPLFVLRSARHPRPVIELPLFRVRSFSVANAGAFSFSIGFFALLLCNVLFLTGVWGYSILGAGIALTPGPLMAALTAPVGGRLADRFGQRVVAVPGALLFTAGALLFALGVEAAPDYAGQFLPATLLTGAGVGLTLPGFGSAAVAELPAARFATGSAVTACLRQIGAVLGISGLVAVLATPAPGGEAGAFGRVWSLIAGTGALSAVLALTLGRVRARHVDQPLDAATATGLGHAQAPGALPAGPTAVPVANTPGQE